LAVLGTANARTSQAHVVPVWFLWDGTSMWPSAFISTPKVEDLVANSKAAILIEPAKTGRLQAVLFEGLAEVIQEPRQLVQQVSMRIYAPYMGEEGAQAPEPVSCAPSRSGSANRRLTCWKQPKRKMAWNQIPTWL